MSFDRFRFMDSGRGRNGVLGVAGALLLAVAAAPSTGCSGDDPVGTGGSSSTSSSSAVDSSSVSAQGGASTSMSTYDSGPGGYADTGSIIPTDATSGVGGFGGFGGAGGAPACGDVANIDADCESCLTQSCCGALSDCEADASCLSCLDGDDASCANAAFALALCAHGSCDAVCAGQTKLDCAPPLPAPSNGSCVDANATCNPVTNTGCDPGQVCRPTANGPACKLGSQSLCSTCMADVECPASTVCIQDGLLPYLGHCGALCCADGDCSGLCTPLAPGQALGVCG